MSSIGTREDLVAALRARTRRTRVAWQASDDLSVDEWKLAGPGLGMESRASGWWLGDWVRFGAKRYGLSVADAALITGYEEQTLYNLVSIAAKFPISRRRETLSWSHHADVAALPIDEQDLWLQRAVDEHLSVQELRTVLRQARRDARAAATQRPEEIITSARELATLECPHCHASIEVDNDSIEALRRSAAQA